MIIYLHGFNSAGSPENDKVIALKTLDDVHIVTYDSFADPRTILKQIQTEVEDINDKVFVGTSLGGYFAAHLAKHYGVPSVLINPAYAPEESLKALLGITLTNFVSGKRDIMLAETVKAYAEMPSIQKLTDYHIIPLVIIAEDDELLSPQASKKFFSELIVVTTPTGGHRYDQPEQIIDEIQDYLSDALFVTDLDS